MNIRSILTISITALVKPPYNKHVCQAAVNAIKLHFLRGQYQRLQQNKSALSLKSSTNNNSGIHTFTGGIFAAFTVHWIVKAPGNRTGL